VLTAVPSHVAIALFASCARLIARLPPTRLERALEPRRRRGDADAVAARVERVLSRTEPVLRHTCLTRGLTRYYFLRRAGADVQLVFGLGEIDGRHEGHCWIRRDGEIYREATDPDERFATIYVIPSR
jgi:hypothetical protein